MIDVKIKADASKVDYHKIIEFIKKKLNVSRSKVKRIIFKIIDTTPAKDALLRLIKIKLINRFLCNWLSELVKKNISVNMDIKSIKLKFKGENMNISLDCSIENLNDILSFAENKIHMKDKNMKSIIISSIRAVKDIVDDDIKLKLISRVLNDSGNEICEYLSKLISEKAFEIQIDNINFETENDDGEELQ